MNHGVHLIKWDVFELLSQIIYTTMFNICNYKVK